MGVYRQGSRAVTLLQGMARHVEAVLGYLDCLMGHHCRRGPYGFPDCSLRLPDHQFYLHLADHDPGLLPLFIPHRPQPLV